MNKMQFKTRKEVSAFLKENNIDTTNWTEDKWQSINKSQAEIHIQALAEAMWDTYNESKPKKLEAGEWHIPFGDKLSNEEFKKISDWKDEYGNIPSEFYFDFKDEVERNSLKIATARCARISYETLGDNPKVDYEADIKLHNRLLESKHLSCFEHCARAMSDEEYYSSVKGKVPTQVDEYGITNLEIMPYSSGDPIVGFKGYNPNNGTRYGWCNNFRGFIQYRYLIEYDKNKR